MSHVLKSRSSDEVKSMAEFRLISRVFMSGWTSGSMSKSLCISCSPSQSNIDCVNGSCGLAVDVSSPVELILIGKGADESNGDGARISRRRFSIALSSTGEDADTEDVSLKLICGVDNAEGEGLSSSSS